MRGAVVKKLATTITDNKAHVSTYRYFTGLPIVDYLLKRKAFLSGTVINSNRTGGAVAQLANDKSLKRGDNACLVREDRRSRPRNVEG